MSNFLYDSRDARCKTPFGAAATDEVVHFRVFLPIYYQLRDPCLPVSYTHLDVYKRQPSSEPLSIVNE